MQRNTSGKRRFQTTAIAAAVSAALAAPQSAAAQELEEIVVTATRRATSVQDVPYNISAYTGDSLEQREITALGEFVRRVPGLSFNDVGLREAGNNSTLVMRGLSAEPQSGAGEIPNLARPTVSTYVGETPVYYSLKLTDIERIEVLRGPQGTLYGAGSLGGTLRIIPRKPDTSQFESRVRAGGSSTANADDLNYDIDAMLNVPISDSAAFRLSAGYGQVAGFVDAVSLGNRGPDGAFLLEDPGDFLGSGPDRSGSMADSNEGDVSHVRAAVLWDINESVEALLTYHHQEVETDNYQAESFGEDRTLRLHGTNPLESSLDLASMEATADLGFATLTSATSYYDLSTETTVDASGIYEDYFAYFYYYYPRISTISNYVGSDESFVQELRLASSGGNRIDWIVGGFYLDQKLDFTTVQTMPGFEGWFEASGLQAYYGTPVPLTNPPNLVYRQDRTTKFEEMALFGEVSLKVSDAWQITAGARVFEQTIDNDNVSILPTCYTILESFGAGFYCGDPPLGGSSNQSRDTVDDSVFKVNTSYAINDNSSVYFTWSQGFRNGGVNALPTVGFVDDSLGGAFPNVNTFTADKVDNLEIGIKGNLANKTAQYSVALFSMDWENAQARIAGAFSGVDGVGNSNADARSRGLELEIGGVAGDQWSYTLGYTYTDAEFVDDGEIYTSTVTDGTPLPGHSEHMAAVSVSYSVPIAENALRFTVDGFYRSDYDNGLPGSNAEYRLDSYTIWNANVAYHRENWTLRLFSKNVTDKEAAVSASLISPQTNRLVLVRPRTVGLSATYFIR